MAPGGDAPLPAGWVWRRSTTGKPGAGYYLHEPSGETKVERPQERTAFEMRRERLRCVKAVGEALAGPLGVDRGEAEDVAEFILERWDESGGAADSLEAFREAIGGASSGLSKVQSEDVFHLIHFVHPVKRRGYLAAKLARERGFDARPPPGWEVRESTSTLGAFYYVHSSTGETSVARPGAALPPPPPPAAASGSAKTALSAQRRKQREEEDVYVETTVEMRTAAQGEATIPRPPPFLSEAACAVSTPAAAAKAAAPTSLLVKATGGAMARAALLDSELLELQKKKAGRVGGGEGGGWRQWMMPTATAAPAPKDPASARLGMSGGDPRALPIYQHRDGLIVAISAHPVLIIIGETGSGKTSQVPQYVADAVPGRGVVAVTQPRRVSAVSVAQRVAEERRWVGGMGRVGDEVGYSVRFDDRTSPATRIKYMTDGVLLRELLTDPSLGGYKLVMIDEAHERTLTSDTLLYLLKLLLESKARPDLRVLISSATLDAEKFSRYFGGAAAFYIPGRTHPVETFYVRSREEDWYAMALKVVFEIHVHEGPGDILVFLTGAEEIDAACQICYEWYVQLRKDNPDTPMDDLLILPLYSSLVGEVQSSIFDPAPPRARKVIFSTNVAETSITVDGIVYVVDSGFARVKTHDPASHMDCLLVAPISQAAARQRAGRAGRTRPGKCFRLYTEESYNAEMLPQTVPEVQRENLETTLLLVKQMPAQVDVAQIDFLDTPPLPLVHTALFNLYHLGALDDKGDLTETGRDMLKFPVEPPLAKMLLAAAGCGCAAEACAVVGLLTCGAQVFHRPRGKEKEADWAQGRFVMKQGDHATLLRVLAAAADEQGREDGDVVGWCRDRFVNPKAVTLGWQIAEQLMRLLVKHGFATEATDSGDAWHATYSDHHAPHAPRPVLHLPSPHSDRFRKSVELIADAIVAASPTRIARRHEVRQNVVQYRCVVSGITCPAHPSSIFAHRSMDGSPEWVAYHELIQTRREYIRTLTAVDPSTLPKHCPTLYHAVRTEYKGAAAKEMLDAAAAEWAMARKRMRDDNDDGGVAKRPRR